MNSIIFLIVFGFITVLMILVAWLNHKLERENKKNRIIQAFIAGITRTISDYQSKTDIIRADEKIPNRPCSIPIPYEILLDNIDWEFSKGMLLEHYEKWLKNDRSLFSEEPKFRDDGFNFMYLDFFDRQLKLWHSDELLSECESRYLRDDVDITEDNINELQGEIAIYKDLIGGKLDDTSFTADNIDSKLEIMFPHIKSEKIVEIKNEILKVVVL